MVLIDGKHRSLTFTIMYVGPGGAGKRTSLRGIAESWKRPVETRQLTRSLCSYVESPAETRGPLGFRVSLRLQCPRRLPLFRRELEACFREVDGLIFVADSQLRKLYANQKALAELNSALELLGRSLGQMPHAFQWNKCEMPDAILPQDLERRLNQHKAPSLSTTALLNLNVTRLLSEFTGQIVERMGMNLTSGKYRLERLRKAVGRKRWPLNE